MKPSPIGIITTFTIERNIATTFTFTVVFKRKYVIAGVTTGASKVLTLVIPTESATSPFDRYVITFDDVPPGQVPTRTTPAIRAGSRLKILLNKNARIGIIRNCARQPQKMSFGRVNTSLKSSILRVSPIPNITTIKR